MEREEQKEEMMLSVLKVNREYYYFQQQSNTAFRFYIRKRRSNDLMQDGIIKGGRQSDHEFTKEYSQNKYMSIFTIYIVCNTTHISREGIVDI